MNKKGFSLIAIIVIVAVIGIAGYAVVSQKMNMSTTNPTATPSGSASATPESSASGSASASPAANTSGWKTYANAKYGFEVKYPASAVIKEYEPNIRESSSWLDICFQSTNQPGNTCFEPHITVDVYTATDKHPMEFANAVYTQKKTITVAGRNALRFSEHVELVPQDYVILPGDSYTFVVSSDVKVLPGKIDFDKFLSTFKFTSAGQADTSGWKTYVDSAGRFSVQYPTNLTAEVEQNSTYSIDSVHFKAASRSPFYISIITANVRWPNITTLINDQFWTSKGVDNPPPPTRTLPSGIKLWDVGQQASAHQFVGELSSTQFIVLYFEDETLIEKALASLKFTK